MGEVVRLSDGMVSLQDAVDAFLDHHDLAQSTRRVYRASLASLVAEIGPATAVGELSSPMLAGWFRDRHATAAPATWNRELATLRAAVGWWRRRGWLAGDPNLARRRERVDRTRALTHGQLERLFARRDLLLRERTLWRLLYETAARANELLRGSRGWLILTMLLTGALTVWFNFQHAGTDPGRRLAAALPPVLMMLAFEIDIQIVKWVMTALGKPLGPIAPPPPQGMLPGPVPGALWRPDGQGWNVPHPGLPEAWRPAGSGPVPPGRHLPENSQNGQPGLAAGAGGDPVGVTKRQRIEEYLDWLGPEELQNVTVRELTAELASQGLEVTERYVHGHPLPAHHSGDGRPYRRRYSATADSHASSGRASP